MRMTDPAPTRAPITARRIIEIVAHHTGVTVAEIKGPRRFPQFVNARHTATLLIRQYRPDLSYPQIGRLLGGRDHSTIIHGQRLIMDRLRRDPDLQEAAEHAEFDVVYEALHARAMAVVELTLEKHVIHVSPEALDRGECVG
ncbi:MAG: helix-turn-helix domain-containing protein [Blastomonas sp.]